MSSTTPPTRLPPPPWTSASGAGVDFDRPNVQPPAALFLSREDQLIVTIYNAVAGVSVEIRARILMPEGILTPHIFTVTPTSARARFVQVFDLVEGFLVGASAGISAGSARRGQTFVQASLGRGPATAPVVLQTLLSDYVTPDAAIAWPNGLVRQSVEGPGIIRSIAGTNQAAGVEISETVPAGSRWRLRSLRAQLVTSAAVANRRVHLFVDDGATRLFELAAADVQAASLTRNYNCQLDALIRATQDLEVYIPLPQDVLLLQGWRIRTVTTAFDAADDWGAPQLVVEEWIEA